MFTAPLALALVGSGVPAQAVAEPVITPGNGSVVTSAQVTIRAKAAIGGGTLYVDGVPVDTGKNKWLTHTLDGRDQPNRTHTVRVDSPLGIFWDEAKSTFRMAVPASAPSGVTARVQGNKVTVRWSKGSEPDLTGYTVTSDVGSRSVSAGSCGGGCSTTFNAPASASGQLRISVVAKRKGAAPSGASHSSVRLTGTGPSVQQPPNDNNNDNGNNNQPYPAWNWPSSSPKPRDPFPTVAPNPDDFSSQKPAPNPYPTYSGAPELETSLAPFAGAETQTAAVSEDLQWGKSLAIALVLLLCAAHLGTWTRRLRAARVVGTASGLSVVPGSAHARVEASRRHIEAALAAARGAEAPSKAAKKPKRRRRSRNASKAEAAVPSELLLNDPDQFELLDPADTASFAPDDDVDTPLRPAEDVLSFGPSADALSLTDSVAQAATAGAKASAGRSGSSPSDAKGAGSSDVPLPDGAPTDPPSATHLDLPVAEASAPSATLLDLATTSSEPEDAEASEPRRRRFGRRQS